MKGNKLFAAIIAFMVVIAVLGAWAMVDGAIAYRERPLLQDYTKPGFSVSRTNA